MYMITPISSAAAMADRTPNREPFLARSTLPAPRFWLTKVGRVMLMAVTGRNAKPSTLL